MGSPLRTTPARALALAVALAFLAACGAAGSTAGSGAISKLMVIPNWGRAAAGPGCPIG